MSAFGAPTYALSNFAVISARDDIDSPLPMPAKDRPFRGHFYVMHRGRFTGIFRDACRLLDALIDQYREQLRANDFRAGCPVAAVSVEAGEPSDRERMAPVVEHAAAVFDRWSDLIAQRFVSDGIPLDSARELAVTAMSTLEGALLLARVRRDLTPLDVVHRQLRSMLLAQLPEGNRNGHN
ncbi:hypothetical protein MSHO_18230 [Mycobacterium shottsii]|uniref:Transcriptional regulator LmrA/YxaF-like C-terminal domain-containing protein n=1 Tax=Mycobacterium shottsii TaxID=133549 RepID=A0A7I7L9N4_9MYCO|nr:hypothetical protein MSHO_18230 [Mycobacterium shottsii]